MKSLLIDYNSIKDNEDFSQLLKLISPVFNTDHQIGILLIISDDKYHKLENIKKEERAKYINSQEFLSSIYRYCYLVIDKEQKKCEILELKDIDYLKIFLEGILTNFPLNFTIFISIPLSEIYADINILKKYTDCGFSSPYICDKSPLYLEEIPRSLILLRQNQMFTEQSNSSLPQIYYILFQYTKGIHSLGATLENPILYCTMQVCLDNKAIEYFEQSPNIGFSWNKEKIFQIELAGKLKVVDILPNLTHVLGIDYESILDGTEESVSIIEGYYTFHTHPKQAYETYNTNIGWPSVHDYIAILHSCIEYGCIMHIVVSIEGIYIISMNEYWLKNIEKLDKDAYTFIKENLGIIPGNIDNSVIAYINKINTTRYNGLLPIFTIQYLPKGKYSQIFELKFRNTGLTCKN